MRTLLPTIASFFAIACQPSGEVRPEIADSASLHANTAMTTMADSVDWNAVTQAMGRESAVQPGDVHRFSIPRSDLRVTVGQVQIKTAFALGGWVAMKGSGRNVMAMGDLVLLDDEVAPVMKRLQEGGIEQTAVHHHLLHETPRVYYMHVHAYGDAMKVAETLRDAIALSKAPAASPSSPAPAPVAIELDTALIASTLGRAGRVNGGVYQVSVPRVESIHEGSFEIPPAMGLGTAINFQPTGGGKAAITGDFVLTASEVNAVIRTLRDGGIEVTALHNHLLGEEPRLFFMHFWANDDAASLARVLRAALDKTNSKPG
ncbi:MAG: DUF1259 domain-containing protein [Gemmatimonadaceae bacterium]